MDEIEFHQRMRRLWSDTEWCRVPPKKDQLRRGEVRRNGTVSYGSRAHGEIG